MCNRRLGDGFKTLKKMCKTKSLQSELNALKARHNQILTGDMWSTEDKEDLLIKYNSLIEEKEKEVSEQQELNALVNAMSIKDNYNSTN